jgi:undecaprenyl diphosphate synthase
LALSYRGRWDIVSAVQMIALDVRRGKVSPEDLSDELFSSYLQTSKLPDPDLLIRTSGEMRLSNFLLWELAYSEIYITDKYWPEFRRKDLYEALYDYFKRERRFGKISAQLLNEESAKGKSYIKRVYDAFKKNK